jgi:hypothetical protein
MAVQDFSTPITADMDVMDLHVGCFAPSADPAKRAVVVFLQPPEALLTDNKFGAVLPNWHAVYDVMFGLLDMGAKSWGPPYPGPSFWEKGIDVTQVLYALERQAVALDARADRLGADLDYSAELLAEDADRLREAIVVIVNILVKAVDDAKSRR